MIVEYWRISTFYGDADLISIIRFKYSEKREYDLMLLCVRSRKKEMDYEGNDSAYRAYR